MAGQNNTRVPWPDSCTTFCRAPVAQHLTWLVSDQLKRKAGRWWWWRLERSHPWERAAEALPGDGSTTWVQTRSGAKEGVKGTSVPCIRAPVS